MLALDTRDRVCAYDPKSKEQAMHYLKNTKEFLNLQNNFVKANGVKLFRTITEPAMKVTDDDGSKTFWTRSLVDDRGEKGAKQAKGRKFFVDEKE